MGRGQISSSRLMISLSDQVYNKEDVVYEPGAKLEISLEDCN